MTVLASGFPLLRKTNKNFDDLTKQFEIIESIQRQKLIFHDFTDSRLNDKLRNDESEYVSFSAPN